MNELEILPPLSKESAIQVGQEIDSLLGQISAHELRLARSYARLGGLLREVKNEQYWMIYGYDRFSSYLEFVRQKIGRERSQVYAILSVAETLLPLVSEEQLEAVGVTKAQELRRFVREGGNIESYINIPIDPKFLLPTGFDQIDGIINLTTVRLMDYASDPKVTASMLRVKINELLHVHEGPRGTWVDLGGFFVKPDERKELNLFWDLGRKLFSKPDEQSDHVWKHDVMIAAIRECISSWEPEVGNEK